MCPLPADAGRSDRCMFFTSGPISPTLAMPASLSIAAVCHRPMPSDAGDIAKGVREIDWRHEQRRPTFAFERACTELTLAGHFVMRVALRRLTETPPAAQHRQSLFPMETL